MLQWLVHATILIPLICGKHRVFVDKSTDISPNPTSLVRDAARLQESLGELIRVIQHRDRDRASRYDLSVSQCRALEALAREGPMPVTHLGNALLLEKSTASRLARGLMERGLLRKRSPRTDSRVVILQVTEQGIRLSRKILNDLSEELMEVLEDVQPEARGAIPHLLDQLTRALLSHRWEMAPPDP